MAQEMIKQPLEDIIGDRFGRYSKYIIQERALPDVRDGLKPVQRRILYAMYHEKNTFEKPYRKSAKTVGIVIGNYHPHGDISVYEAMVRLSQSWKMNMLLVDMQGNNGSIDDDPPAAMRYTEARLSKLSNALLENIEEDVVSFVLNFDDMTTEPSILPARYPNLLVNGASGIAAGYATNIPPFNFNEVLDATIFRLSNPNSTIDDLMSIIKGPDFPTGAIIQSKAGIKDILTTGRGRVIVRAKSEIVEKRNLTQIIITELPYDVIKSNVVRKIDELRFAKANEGLGDVMDVRDESDRNGLRIVIDCRAKSDAQSILNMFYKETQLQVPYNANMVSIINQRPVVSGVDTILDAYIEFRQEVVLNRSKYRYAQKEKRLHILEGLIKAVSILDEIIAMIRSSKNRGDSRDNIMDAFGFTYEQASAIVDLQLYRLSSTDIVQLKAESKKLNQEVEALSLLINNKELLNLEIIREFNDLKEQFDTPRRSVIEDEISELEIDHLSLINNEDVMLTLSKDGYLKKVSLRSYNSSKPNEITLNEGDVPIFISQVQTLDQLIFVTNQGRYGHLMVHDIEEARWRDLGSHLNQYVKLEPKERVVSAFMSESFETHQFVNVITKEGMIKRTLLSEFEVRRNNRLYDCINLSNNDEVIGAYLSSIGDDILIASSTGNIIRLELDEINNQGLRAKGMIAMRLRAGDTVSSAVLLKNETDLFIQSNRGGFKRIKTVDIAVNNRATMGILAARVVKSNPHLFVYVGAANVQDSIRLYKDGVISVLEVKDIPIMDYDASFSSVLGEDHYDIIGPSIYAEMMKEPKVLKELKDEPLKLNL